MKPIENLYKKNDVVRELPFLFFSCGNSFKYSSGLEIFGDANMTLVSCDPSCIHLYCIKVQVFGISSKISKILSKYKNKKKYKLFSTKEILINN